MTDRGSKRRGGARLRTSLSLSRSTICIFGISRARNENREAEKAKKKEYRAHLVRNFSERSAHVRAVLYIRGMGRREVREGASCGGEKKTVNEDRKVLYSQNARGY